MGHHLYAEIDEDEKQAYYDGTVGKRLDPTKGEYPYEHSPSISVKRIRSSDWLPEHLADAVWEEFTPNQAQMYADALARQVGSHRFDEAEDPEADDLLTIVEWLRYWARQDVDVRGAP